MSIGTVEHKTVSEITNEWDLLAPIRYRQIVDGRDLTFWHVLLPAVISEVRSQSPRTVLDAGCGVGVLTHKLKEVALHVVGVDPSKESIKIAQEKFETEGLEFHALSMEKFTASRGPGEQFDVVVANMVMMDVINLRSFLSAVRKILSPEGVFVFSITHPCFWPEYYGYGDKDWFNYRSELIIEAPFRISAEEIDLRSTHTHRPLSRYFAELSDQKLSITSLQEPWPPPEIEQQYSVPWRFPRYIVGRCKLLYQDRW